MYTGFVGLPIPLILANRNHPLYTMVAAAQYQKQRQAAVLAEFEVARRTPRPSQRLPERDEVLDEAQRVLAQAREAERGGGDGGGAGAMGRRPSPPPPPLTPAEIDRQQRRAYCEGLERRYPPTDEAGAYHGRPQRKVAQDYVREHYERHRGGRR